MSEVSSQAQYLFEKYTSDGAVSLLKSLPNSPEKTFESDWLDFKSGRSKDEDIKRIWSKIIGAFANSEGGVVVWGIISKKDPATGIDAVTGLELVPDVFVLKSRLMELRHGACDPPVSNIKIEGLPISKDKPEGFVVCHIPESSMKPHRSEFAERRFYLRIGDSSRDCNVSLLRQLFYPKRNPRVEATIKSIRRPDVRLAFTPIDMNRNYARFAFEIGIRNTSEISIDDAQVHVECVGYTLFSFSWNKVLKEHDVEFLPTVVSLGSSIHPKIGQTINILFASESLDEPRDISVRIFARDMTPRKAILPFITKEGESASVEALP
jgi:predicted HTH transcriptional regulator